MKYYTLTIKTTCGLLTWSVYAESEEDAKAKAIAELLREFEIGGYKVQTIEKSEE